MKRSKPADYVYTETEVITWQGIVERVNETTEQAEATVNAAVEQGKQAIDTTIEQAQGDVSKMIGQAETAVNAAIDRTEEAITNANTAIVNANNAADNANSAADDALNATAEAINAAEAANSAAERADAATHESVVYSMPQVLSEVEQGQARGNILAANAIICSATGTDIELTDSANQPLHGLKIFGKSTQLTTTGANIFGGDALADRLVEVAQCSKDETAGTIIIPGSAIKDKVIYSDFKPNTRYSFILKVSVSGSASANLQIVYTDGTKKTLYYAEAINDGIATGVIVSESNKSIECLMGVHMSKTTLYYNECGIFEGVIAEEDAPKYFEPYTGGLPSPSPDYPQNITSIGDKGEVNVKITGRNLFPYSTVDEKTFSTQWKPSVVIPAGTYTLSYNIKSTDIDSDKRRFMIFDKDGNALEAKFLTDGDNVIKFTTAVPTAKFQWDASESTGKSENDTVTLTNVMLNKGSTALPYEHYTEQTINIPTPNGLLGVPTINGGWVCDEIDFERGVYIQRVKKIAMPQSWAYTTSYKYPIFYTALSSGVYTDAGLSDILARDLKYNVASTYGTYAEDNTFALRSDGQQIFARADAYKTGAEFKEAVKNGSLWVGLITPIETPLTEEELTAYRTLHTNKPNTIVSNDEEAEMQVEYAADTKTYIDNKFAELATALLNK